MQALKDTVLGRIIEAKRAEVEALRQGTPLMELRRRALEAPPARDFLGSLRAAPGAAIIAEIKKASPSAGQLAQDVSVAAQAQAYEQGGAAALSVLTDQAYFGGSLLDLEQAREAVALPVLRKDFTIDPAQIYEARLHGADAVLLIVAALEPGLLAELHGQALELGLTPLVEVHQPQELQTALDLRPVLLGVNNRNLKTLEVDLGTCLALSPLLPPALTAVAESGIESPADVARLRAVGYGAFLVGSALMRAGDPRAAVAALAGARR